MTDPAKAIVRARRAAGLTQAELARRSRTSQPAVNRYESGRVRPRPDTLRRLLESCRTAAPRPSEVLEAHREDVLAFARRQGASRVLVFGSVARNEDDSDSDIDLLMDIPPTYSLFAMARLRRELSKLLGMPVDVGSADDLRPRIRERVLPRGAPPLRTSRRGDVERVADMLEAIARIQSWRSDEAPRGMYQAAVLHELMIIGEAASRLSDAFKEARLATRCRDVIGQRVQLAHHYWDTQWARIQQTVAEDIPALKAALLQGVDE